MQRMESKAETDSEVFVRHKLQKISTLQTAAEKESYVRSILPELPNISPKDLFLIIACKPDLLFELNSTWLRECIKFNAESFFSLFLNNFTIADLDKLNHDWVVNLFLEDDLLGRLISSLKWTQQPSKCNSLFEYVGRELLRNKFDTQGLIIFLIWAKDETFFNFLAFLDGEDHWVRKKVTTGKDLGRMIHAFISLTDKEPTDEIKKSWQTFLNYLDNNWQEKFLNNPFELNNLIRGFGYKHKQFTQSFLEIYLDHSKYSNLDAILFVMRPYQTTKIGEKTSVSYPLPGQFPLQTNACFAFLQSFEKADLYNIFLRQKKFSETLAEIDKYKEVSFVYEPLLYALTAAYHHELTIHKPFLSNTSNPQLGSLDSLMKSICEEKHLDAAVSGISEGNIGALVACYQEKHAPQNKSDRMGRGMSREGW